MSEGNLQLRNCSDCRRKDFCKHYPVRNGCDLFYSCYGLKTDSEKIAFDAGFNFGYTKGFEKARKEK